MPDFNRIAATDFLAQLLSGVPHKGGPDDLTFSLDEIEIDGNSVTTIVETVTGDKYRVTVDWLADRSP